MPTTVIPHVPACCNTAPFESEYAPKGTFERIGDLPVYFVGEKGSKAVLPALRRSLPRMGDFFRGDPWIKMPLVMSELMDHLNRTVPWPVVDTDMKSVTAHLRAEGASSVGAIGLCWSAGQVARGPLEGAFDAIAAAHPWQVNKQVLTPVPCPIALLPSNDLLEVFETMGHGFLAARANYANEDNARCAREALTILAKFFHENLKA
ncbi:hypothetical protein BDK51DRAFT_52060 [Blyttiomyces helicus]|uniref:Dienelactone hydrolase domain-containing protein n=1 Tax=Blyttiomyces helicus TaxID=388810 RepID=A0A4P9WI00_9FUNG|nr:hypothetical protein BDK51DRAFT_52060 [Blyttiomyces helicus]|eukprot:RKO90176.1 hypothetical protein BDK51DRAFT_52060 [Blyttiomyces helicus]